MTEFNEETVKDLTRLSRIDVPAEELHAFYGDLKRILAYCDQLQEVDLTHLPPYSHVQTQGVESLREDVVTKCLDRTLFLNNAPDHVGSMIRVPPVLKNNSKE